MAKASDDGAKIVIRRKRRKNDKGNANENKKLKQ